MTRREFIICISLLAVSPLAAKDAPKDARVPVVILAGGSSATGLSDPSHERINAALDVISQLKKSKALKTVMSESDAVVVVEITERAMTERGLVVKGTVTANGHTATLEGRGLTKQDAAHQFAFQLNTWATANQATLQTLAPPKK